MEERPRAEVAIDQTNHMFFVCPHCNCMMTFSKPKRLNYKSDCVKRPKGFFEIDFRLKCLKCRFTDHRKIPSSCNPDNDLYISSKTNINDNLNLKILNPLCMSNFG